MSNPFGSPFQNSVRNTDPAPTGSLTQAAPVSPVQAQALPSPVQSRPLAAPAANYAAPAQPSPRLAAAQPPAPQTHGGVAGWSIQGGSPITVGQGETAEILARRYGIPAEALIRSNGFTSASQVQPGTRIIIPVYNAALAASSGARVAANAPAPSPALARSAHPEPLSRAEPVKLAKAPAHAEKLAVAGDQDMPKSAKGAARVKLAEQKPAAKSAPVQKPDAAPKAERLKETPKKLAEAPKSAPVAPEPKKVAMLTRQDTIKPAKVEQPVVESPKPAAAAPVANSPADTGKSAAASDSANPEFRWPARGRIIQGFKPGGNDGINIAVPEGTSVKAAEGGVVAYAGSELKGYGNLILIRHPNGFVSAYANNGDLEVKRGETVKRGQTIAKSGQSGNVNSPQLHFELRKGATPVDPTQYLAGL
ncbi:MAG TPA: peptidoglycan DD-metalloendopeptidase family protein [Beijerinckia sp.]|nr:peptidoglycan DD-metalloendopeptidase family protein [Beijerinckia sp.]